MIQDPRQIATMNYLVPASGTTTGYVVTGTFTSTPSVQDWRLQELDGEPFVPSGVFIDNSAGIGELVVKVRGSNFSVACPPGARVNAQYPAPLDQITEITGDGDATVVFVNFPVLPTSDVPQDFDAITSRIDLTNTELGEIDANTLATKMAIGDTTDAAWNGTDASATVISLLKALVLKP